MSADPKHLFSDPALSKRLTYDPHNLSAMDLEDRKQDDLSEGIDWDEIIATTQGDWEAGRYKEFKATDYPTDEAFIAAMEWCTDEELGRKRTT